MSLQHHLENVRRLAAEAARPVSFMEVCGTHTMAAFRSGLRSLLPANVRLLSGPGCPVCVTPNEFIDCAVEISRQPKTVIATFGDMVRVPGTRSSLEMERARGAKVLVVYSPLDALGEARRNPGVRFVFLGVGFETTAPAVAWTIKKAALDGIANFSVLCAHKLIPPAMAALLRTGEVRVDGFLCPGHVSVIIGAGAYDFICRDFNIPCVVAGFEPQDMLAAMEMLLRQMAEKRAAVEIQYTRSVQAGGNAEALAVIAEVFEEEPQSAWRGLGFIPKSGLRIREIFSAFDARKVFAQVEVPPSREPAGCRCGEVLRGVITPPECPLFGKQCAPDNPVGACMVSSEGTCAAYYKYSRKTLSPK